MTERENALKSFRRENPQWIPSARKAVDFIFPSAVRERAPGGNDWYGVYWEDNMVRMAKPRLASLAGWEKELTFPDYSAVDWAGCAARDLANTNRDEKVVCAMILVGPFERMHALLEFEEALISLYEEPEAVQSFLAAHADSRLELIRRVQEAYKPDVVYLHDDYGMKENMFFPAELWREFFKPALHRFVDEIHRGGSLAAMHSCGRVEAVVGDFVECGFDIWDSVQNCNDLHALVEQYGRDLTFSAGMDQQGVLAVEGCTPDQARAEVRWTIDTLAKYGGLVVRPVQPRVPADIIDVCFDEIESYGKEYYARHPARPANPAFAPCGA